MDFSQVKQLTLPEGEVTEIICNGVTLWKGGYTNQVPISTEIDGTTIFNSGKGYREGYRLSTSGAEKSQTDSVVTGFIPAKRGDVIRMKGVTWGANTSSGYCYIQTYNKSGTVLHSANIYGGSGWGISDVINVDKNQSSIDTDKKTGVCTFNLVYTNTTDFDYIRISATGKGTDMIVTINEEITV